MKKLALLTVLIGSMMMSACAVIPSNMAIFSPVAIDAVSPNQAFVNNNVKPLKRGEATQTGVVLFSTGDASIEAAMKNGNITKVHHVDYKTTTVLFLYTKQTTIVYGEKSKRIERGLQSKAAFCIEKKRACLSSLLQTAETC